MAKRADPKEILSKFKAPYEASSITIVPAKRTKKGEPNGQKKATTLSGKLSGLSSEQALDVTNITETGGKVSKVKMPKAGNKIKVNGLPLISNTEESLLRALDILCKEDAKYTEKADEFRKRQTVKESKPNVETTIPKADSKGDSKEVKRVDTKCEVKVDTKCDTKGEMKQHETTSPSAPKFQAKDPVPPKLTLPQMKIPSINKPPASTLPPRKK